ncbi:carboxyl transferase domain-containing protein [Amycolatopsis carbonis]|uniref:carboxyl transferase domain-containing protein n=1 Tax=Amycolatopsis carbonis TaxID=715471 RepID=UPI00333FCB71
MGLLAGADRLRLRRRADLISQLPSHNHERAVAEIGAAPVDRLTGALRELVSLDGQRPYDVREVFVDTVDDGDVFEVSADRAENIVCDFARLAYRVKFSRRLCGATIPGESLAVRKAYGGAYTVMDSSSIGCRCSACLAYERSGGHGRGATNIIFRRDAASWATRTWSVSGGSRSTAQS